MRTRESERDREREMETYRILGLKGRYRHDQYRKHKPLTGLLQSYLLLIVDSLFHEIFTSNNFKFVKIETYLITIFKNTENNYFDIFMKIILFFEFYIFYVF